ncbi:MAG TPA: hypothetical protein VM100_10895, partial [Longimicrobiales bacterium]|nr:hypothetical protein [Longimicrobiales bacterium]
VLGARHTCALVSDGRVACWGALPGAGPSPKILDTNIRFDALAAGGEQTCGRSGTALYCWGRGGAVPGGESTIPRLVPGNIPLTGQLSVGRDHACALATDGAGYCWGDNSLGQLGTGDRNVAYTPTPVLTTQRFQHLRPGPGFTCGLPPTGPVLCWGANAYGQLGRGFFSASEPLPAPIRLSLAGSLSSGAGEHVCTITGGGPFVWCWGRNDTGQLNDGTTISKATPQAAGFSIAIVTTKTGTCWSDGKADFCRGLIGGFQYTDFMGNGFSSLQAGEEHVCANFQFFNGSPSGVYCWGDNSFGQLGDGTLNSSRAPVFVKLNL